MSLIVSALVAYYLPSISNAHSVI
uniref:Uncharacterized protein n=1 Tax=Anguilla anguilla TaxID=7936 RepID=A0A0E9XAC7_ANGAN